MQQRTQFEEDNFNREVQLMVFKENKVSGNMWDMVIYRLATENGEVSLVKMAMIKKSTNNNSYKRV